MPLPCVAKATAIGLADFVVAQCYSTEFILVVSVIVIRCCVPRGDFDDVASCDLKLRTSELKIALLGMGTALTGVRVAVAIPAQDM
eukprot:5995573-Amphidinium_carterae.1